MAAFLSEEKAFAVERDRHPRLAGGQIGSMDEPSRKTDRGIDSDADAKTDADTETEAEAGDVTARYRETDTERLLEFDREGTSAIVAQNRAGYAMLTVRRTADGDELERYYGFDVALDHAAEILGVRPHDLPVPDAAADMGM